MESNPKLRKYDERVDVYSLGMMMFEFLNGSKKRPGDFGLFDPQNMIFDLQLIREHLKNLKYEAGEKERAMKYAEIVVNCLERNPEKRYCW